MINRIVIMTFQSDKVDEFLNKGGKITKGKTKPMANELGISNNNWNQKLSKAEKDAKKSK